MPKSIRPLVGLVLTLVALVAWSSVTRASGAPDVASPSTPPGAAAIPAPTLPPAPYNAPAAQTTPITHAVSMAPTTPAASKQPAATLICDTSGKRCIDVPGAAAVPSAHAPSASVPIANASPAAKPSPVSAALGAPVAGESAATRAGTMASVAPTMPVAYATPLAQATPSGTSTPGAYDSPADHVVSAARPTPAAYTPPTALICDTSGKQCVAAGPTSGASSTDQSGAQTLAALHLPAAADHAYSHHAGHLTAGQQLYYRTNDASVMDPANWSVMAYESKHVLDVYFKGHLFQSYRAVFGRSLKSGGKLYEGDRRTPQGVYHIVSTHRSRRWRYFLKLDYPNNIDRIRFDEMRANGMIPARFREGGQIGIHGTDEPLLNAGLVNWTTGCISVDNSAIGELARLLPIGTIVIINP